MIVWGEGGRRRRRLQNYFHSIHPELDQYCDYTININIVNTLNRKHLEPHIDPIHHQYCVWSFPPMREINKSSFHKDENNLSMARKHINLCKCHKYDICLYMYIRVCSLGQCFDCVLMFCIFSFN